MLRIPVVRYWRLALDVNTLFNREYISCCRTANVCYRDATRTIAGMASYPW